MPLVDLVLMVGEEIRDVAAAAAAAEDYDRDIVVDFGDGG